MMILCPSCGNEVDENVNLCPHCAARVHYILSQRKEIGLKDELNSMMKTREQVKYEALIKEEKVLFDYADTVYERIKHGLKDKASKGNITYHGSKKTISTKVHMHVMQKSNPDKSLKDVNVESKTKRAMGFFRGGNEFKATEYITVTPDAKKVFEIVKNLAKKDDIICELLVRVWSFKYSHIQRDEYFSELSVTIEGDWNENLLSGAYIEATIVLE